MNAGDGEGAGALVSPGGAYAYAGCEADTWMQKGVTETKVI